MVRTPSLRVPLALVAVPLGTHHGPPPVPILVSRNREDALAPRAAQGPRILDQMHQPALQMVQYGLPTLGMRGRDYGSGPSRESPRH